MSRGRELTVVDDSFSMIEPAPSDSILEEVRAFLVSSPTHQQIIDFHASDAAQLRLRYLIDTNRQGTRSTSERAELDEASAMNRFVTLLKAKAHKMMNNECMYCKGHLEERLVTRVQEYEGQWYIIENLPALVCRQCGEIFYTPQAHDRVVDLITGGAEPVRMESVAVMDASKAS